MRISYWSSDVCSSDLNSGGETRLSTFVSGVFLLFLLLVLGPLVAIIPMASLVAVMIMVSIGTFSWRSIRDIRYHPWQSSVVMIVTVVIVVWTHDLAQGVLAGVILSGLFFASRSEEHTSELQSLMRISYAVFCLKKNKHQNN